MRLPYIAYIFIIFALLTGSCRKDIFTDDPSARLTFSTDTVHFDTVFASVGSATKNFKVSNPNNKAVKIKNIRLAGGANSSYRINIDGRATTSFDDYELAGSDSMYIFVEVTVDPNDKTLPFIVEDSILFETNGNQQKIILTSFGQNAHFFENEFLGCDTVWTNDLPYVIYKSIAVSPGCKLTIQKGVKIYSHKGSGIFVYGTLEVNGTKDEPVIFRGDRLEKAYEDEPGQWSGIRFVPKSSGSHITNAIISNADVGIEVDSLPSLPGNVNLKIEKTIIKHMTVAGIVGFSSVIEGKNLLIHSCEQFTFLGELGGDYKFTNCTFENSNTKTARRQPSFIISNADYKDDNNIVYSYDLSAQFRNCIIYGNLEEEIKFNQSGHGAFDTTFLYNIVKTKELSFNNTNQVNKNPKLKSPFQYKFTLDSLSPAINAGIKFPGDFLVTDDILDNPRDDKPDLGCYEYVK